MNGERAPLCVWCPQLQQLRAIQVVVARERDGAFINDDLPTCVPTPHEHRASGRSRRSLRSRLPSFECSTKRGPTLILGMWRFEASEQAGSGAR